MTITKPSKKVVLRGATARTSVSQTSPTPPDQAAVHLVPPNSLSEHPANAALYRASPGSSEEDDGLVASIREAGILEPLLVTLKDRTVISGHRRLRAAQVLEQETVPVRFVDPVDEDAARSMLLDCNVQRAKSDADRLAEFEMRLDIESRAAKKRMSEGGREGGRSNRQTKPASKKGVSRLTSPSEEVEVAEDGNCGKAVELAGLAVGWGGTKARQASYLLRHAPELVERVRAGLSVNQAHKEALAAKLPRPEGTDTGPRSPLLKLAKALLDELTIRRNGAAFADAERSILLSIRNALAEVGAQGDGRKQEQKPAEPSMALNGQGAVVLAEAR